MSNSVGKLVVDALIAAILIPIGLGVIFETNTTGWNATTVVVFTTLFPILLVLAAVSPFIYSATHGSSGKD